MEKAIKILLGVIAGLVVLLGVFIGVSLSISNEKEDASSSQLIESSKIESSQAQSTAVSTSAPSSTASKNTSTVSKTTSAASSKKETVCSHQYSNKTTEPTCTKKGYTTHTCKKCGYSFKDNYVSAEHNYKDYRCTVCKAIDKTHTYEYLVNWILDNGTTNGKNCEVTATYGLSEYCIAYSADLDGSISMRRTEAVIDDDSGNRFLYSSIHTDCKDPECFYYVSITDLYTDKVYDMFTGCINSSTHTKKSPISYDTYNSDLEYDAFTINNALEPARSILNDILDKTSAILSGANGQYTDSGLTIADLGFTSYK